MDSANGYIAEQDLRLFFIDSLIVDIVVTPKGIHGF